MAGDAGGSMTIDLKPVESSQIHAIGHDPLTNTLAIQFKSKGGPGSTYHYGNVPASMHADMLKAKSIGTFFGAHLKADPKKHPFTKQPPKAAA